MQQLNDSLLKKLHEVFTSNKYKLSHSAIHLYGYYVFKLLDSDKPTLSISNKWITSDSGLSTTTIVKSRKELELVGLIKVKKVIDRQMGNVPLTIELIGVSPTIATVDEAKEILPDRGHQALFGFDLATERSKHFNQYRPCDTPQVVTLPSEIKEFIQPKAEEFDLLLMADNTYKKEKGK